jgi:hypothetical protein
MPTDIKFNWTVKNFRFLIYKFETGGVFKYTVFEAWKKKPSTTLWLFWFSFTFRRVK